MLQIIVRDKIRMMDFMSLKIVWNKIWLALVSSGNRNGFDPEILKDDWLKMWNLLKNNLYHEFLTSLLK